MKILTIGDIHGRNNWWKIAINAIDSYDYVVFTGDYVDSFYIRSEKIVHNLNKIIQFKIKYPSKVILLWGNHDVQYISDYYSKQCTGMRFDYALTLNEIFTKHKKQFQFAFQIENYLWTHAGINEWWYRKFNDVLIELDIDNNPDLLADNINTIYNSSKFSLLNTIGGVRGGVSDECGDILWSDELENLLYPVKISLHQIVGHTATYHLHRIDTNTNGSYTYTDVSWRTKIGYSLDLSNIFKLENNGWQYETVAL